MKEKHSHCTQNLYKGRYSKQYGLYLITKCSLSHYEFSSIQRDDIVSAFFHYRDKGDLLLHSFVVMPDHWHALFSLRSKKTLGQMVQSINRYASFPSRRRNMLMPWQREFHDRKIRESESVTDIVRYIENNPARKGLVGSPNEWLWSSAHLRYGDKLDRSFLGHERWDEKG